MVVFKCKMCGGSLELREGASVAECEYCGTEQTVPVTTNEQIVNMLNRANHFRQLFEFDKAMEIYEKILEREDSDPEIYWSIVLCRYGIEYVSDPLTGKKIATCHRTQYASILKDQDYLEALKRSDGIQRKVFEREAEYIDKVQKDILDISRKEKPYDVFICYKETDENGIRTPDSALSQEIYYQLVDKGYKAFFSRITLEDKLGQKYEPYIFSALNSSRVMIVVGTKPEYYNAVWVKNEWNRFLAIMQNDKSRLIIPAYRDMDPYDIPDALSYFQAQDMSKIGFMQDLIRGIDKVLKDRTLKTEPTHGEKNNIATSNVSALLKRGELALEDGEWDKAYKFYDQVLNIDALSSEAYLGQALAKNYAHNVEDLVKVRTKRIDNIEKKKHYLSCEEKDLKCLNDKISNNYLNMTLSIPDEVYYTKEESVQRLIDEEKGFFMYDKLISKAIRFSDDHSIILNVKQQVLDYYNAHLEQAQKEDNLSLEKAQKSMLDKIAAKENEIDRMVKDKEDRYNSLCRYYKDDREKQSLSWFKSKFEAFGDYKDAKDHFNEINTILQTLDEKLQNLRDEKWKVIGSFKTLGLFDGKKKKALSLRLDELDREMEQIQAEQQGM